jgi:site-specific recombinase XerD
VLCNKLCYVAAASEVLLADAVRTGLRITEALQLRVKDLDFARSGVVRRHHSYDQTLQCAFKRAVHAACINKHAAPHALRHCFATHQLPSGSGIRTVQELLRYADAATTVIYTHVLKVGGGAVRSPLDTL